MTAFFIPGIADDPPIREDAYRDLRTQIELEMGSLPCARRIVKLWARRGSVDCVTEVGQRDPLRGGTVIAILTWALIGRSSSAGSKRSGADKAPVRS